MSVETIPGHVQNTKPKVGRLASTLRKIELGDWRAHLDTPTGARAVPARSTSLGRGGLEHS